MTISRPGDSRAKTPPSLDDTADEVLAEVLRAEAELSELPVRLDRLSYPIASSEELTRELVRVFGRVVQFRGVRYEVADLSGWWTEALPRLFPLRSRTDCVWKLTFTLLAQGVVAMPQSWQSKKAGLRRSGEVRTSSDGPFYAPTLEAYELRPEPPMQLVPAPAERAWLSDRSHPARRCLPLMMANQAGWFVLSAHRVEVSWNGGPRPSEVVVDCLEGKAPCAASGHFGHGILTWTIPYLFRTSPGTNLLARGPANWPRDGVSYLEGLVETDWSIASFTVNWQLTRPGHTVVVEIGDPIAMLVPQPRHYLEAARTVASSFEAQSELHTAHRRWYVRRALFNRLIALPGRGIKSKWQRHYFHGTTPDGQPAPEHQTKLRLREFERAAAERQRRRRSTTVPS
ncbi:MAG TPA: DUF6065 family protein [Solirubrobacteraceae bacterium]